MKKHLLLLSAFISLNVMAQNTSIRINELDCDQTGTDAAEFVELYGAPNTSLDGLVMVFINGATDQSYAAYDLTGLSTDANGFFVMGNAGVNGVALEFPGNGLQNGADAVGLYVGTAADWPNGTMAVATNIVDALVYGTNDAPDTGLIGILTPGQTQMDEGASAAAALVSISRVPDGGTALNTSTYVAQAPTPGATNVGTPPACTGGNVQESTGLTSISVCSEVDNAPFTFSGLNNTGDSFWIVITDASGNIVAINETGSFDFDLLLDGQYQVWGISFTGTLDPTTLAVGAPATGISSDACTALSANNISVSKASCSSPCYGGTITETTATNPIVVCSENDNPSYSFDTPDGSGTGYWMAVVDVNGNIVVISETLSFDFDILADGNYTVVGIAFTGTLDPSTLVAGLPVSGISSSECLSLSSNEITVNKYVCSAPVCDGGSVTFGDGSAYAVFCASNAPNNLIVLHNTSVSDNNYSLILTTSLGEIISVLASNTVDVTTLGLGSFKVFGVSYYGNLDPTTIEANDPITGVLADAGCASASASAVEFVVTDCQLAEGCQQLFFSEYLEGSSNTKALEIFNPTNFPIDLNEYVVFRYTNGSPTFTDVVGLHGVLQAGDVYVIANFQSNPAVLALADDTSGVMSFNGDDALELHYLPTETSVDIIGVIGQDPGTQWLFGSGSTANHTLVRKMEVTAGTTNWTLSTGQWDVYPIDDFSHLGSHQFIPCSTVPNIGFETSAQSVAENVGNASIVVKGYNLYAATDVTINVVNGTLISDVDYTNIFPLTLTIPEGNSSQTIDLAIIDDLLEEGAEFATLQLSSASEVMWTFPEHTVSVEANDPNYPIYDIAQVLSADLQGVMDSLDINCELRGIVHGINFNSSGTHFHLIDHTGAIKVFAALSNFGYTVQEGDSVHVGGLITQFMGQAEFHPDYINYISANHTLETATVMSTPLTEANESHLVRVNCVTLTDNAVWETSGEGFYTTVTDGTNTFTLRIEGETNIFGMDVWAGHFSVVGLVEQADATAPYDSNYSIWPRYILDRQDQVVALFTPFSEVVYTESGSTVTLDNLSTGGTTWTWDLSDGTSTEVAPTHFYSYDWLNAHPSFTISLTETNGLGCSDIQTITVDAVYTGIDEILAENTINVYPNPANQAISVSAQAMITALNIVDITGKIVYSSQGMNTTKIQLSIANLDAGAYLIKMNTTSGTAVARFIKN